jgi:hypothetical protein
MRRHLAGVTVVVLAALTVAADGSPFSMADRMRVTSLMRSSITAAGGAGQQRG